MTEQPSLDKIRAGARLARERQADALSAVQDAVDSIDWETPRLADRHALILLLLDSALTYDQLLARTGWTRSRLDKCLRRVATNVRKIDHHYTVAAIEKESG